MPLTQHDVYATFNRSTIQGSRALGYGNVILHEAIYISYTVYPAQNELGFFVSFPSKKVMKNGVQELDERGRPRYINDVFIKGLDARAFIDNAVHKAMLNAGVTVTGNQSIQQAAHTFTNPVGNSSVQANSFGAYANVSTPTPEPQQTQVSPPPVSTENNNIYSGVVSGDGLPF